MLDPKFIRENTDKVKKNTEERGKDPAVVDNFLAIDAKRKNLMTKIEDLNRRRNEIAELLKDKEKRTDTLVAEARDIRPQIETLEKEIEPMQAEWMETINMIPNLHFDDVPKGKSDNENVVEEVVGKPTEFSFKPKDHLEIAAQHGYIDFERGAKVAGSQFYYTANEMPLLEYSLMLFGMQFLRSKGFKVFTTPDMTKSRYYLGTGYSPRGDEAQTYEIAGEDLGLIATAEVTMAGYLADEVLDEKDLPLKFAAVSHCFRKEAGAYGQYSKGLYRVHQFTKLEMFAYTTPEQSQKVHQELLGYEEEIVKQLGLPYRRLQMCTGDLGAMAARKYDLEAWMPGRGDYGEVTSCSNCTDYQARNLNIRYKDKDGKINFVHMLNGTAVVSTRMPLAILENFQQEDGSVKVPDVLVPYMNMKVMGKK